MERLTTDKDVSEMGMFELAHNSCYIKDGKARYRDYNLDIGARELTRKLLKDHAGEDDAFVCNEDFDEWMVDYLKDGMDSIEGLIALFYRNLWAMADLRERLKVYEDGEEKISDSMTAENIENCNSCDAAEKIAELPVLVLAKFSEDLLDMAKENWCESHIIILRRLILAVQQGTRYDETLLPEEAE